MKTKPIQATFFYTKAQLRELTGLSDKQLNEIFHIDDYWEVGLMVKEEIKNKNIAENFLLSALVISRFVFDHIEYNGNFYYIGRDGLRRINDGIKKK